MVLIQYGINDAHIDGEQPEGPSRIPIDAYRENLLAMIGAFQSDETLVVLMTPNQLGPPEPEWQNDRLSRYAEVVRELAKANQAPLVDIWKELPASESARYLLDGVHPNDAGHARVSEAILRTLLPLLQAEDRRTPEK